MVAGYFLLIILFLSSILAIDIRVFCHVGPGVDLCLFLGCGGFYFIVFSRPVVVEEALNYAVDTVATIREDLRCEERELVASGMVCIARWHLCDELNQLRERLLACEAIQGNITKFRGLPFLVVEEDLQFDGGFARATQLIHDFILLVLRLEAEHVVYTRAFALEQCVDLRLQVLTLLLLVVKIVRVSKHF